LAGHIGYLIAGGVITPPGVMFCVLGSMFKFLIPEEIPILDFFFFVFLLIGIIMVIVGATLLLIGLFKYKNRDSKFYLDEKY